jgi:hypothetical protein
MATRPGKFNQDSYDENDPKAKEIFVALLEREGYTDIDTAETFSHDIKAKDKEGNVIYFEVEMKNSVDFTTVETFRYRLVNFLARKEKYHQEHPFHYIIIGNNGYAIHCKSEDIFKPEYKEKLFVNTSHRKGEDEFFRVPKNKVNFFKVI